MARPKKKVKVKKASKKQKKPVPVEPKDSVTQEYDDNIKCISLINIIRRSKDEDKCNKAFEDLLKMLMPKIYKLISRFNIPGYNQDDILQEALFALRYKAIKDYDKARGFGEGPASFDKFALLCIRRHLATEFKSSYQNRRRVLNQSVSIDKESSNHNQGGDEDLSLANILSNPDEKDLITSVSENEYYTNLQNLLLEALSRFEKEVYLLYTQKYSYDEIALKINERRSKIRVNIKGVDNALSRIKHKAKEIIDKYESDEDKADRIKGIDNAIQRIKSKGKKIAKKYEDEEDCRE